MIIANALEPHELKTVTHLTDRVRVLLVVEGTNDIEFLRRISLTLHNHDTSLPNLACMERQGELIFIPFGGGHVQAWTDRLAPLNKPEWHLYDHELSPEREFRKKAVDQVNRRSRCQARLTQKRSIENYLHPQAIAAAGNVSVAIDDFCAVAEVTAKARYQLDNDGTPWELLTPRARSRLAYRAKRWLNTTATERMTVELLEESDPAGEIISWLQTIQQLADAG